MGLMSCAPRGLWRVRGVSSLRQLRRAVRRDDGRISYRRRIGGVEVRTNIEPHPDGGVVVRLSAHGTGDVSVPLPPLRGEVWAKLPCQGTLSADGRAWQTGQLDTDGAHLVLRSIG